MKKTKFLAAGLLTVCACFAGLAHYTSPLPVRSSVCQNTFLGAVAPWDSGCFYHAIHRKKNTPAQINYEKRKLDYFMEKGGLVHTVLWYRAQFHQRFQPYLKVELDEIDEMHWDYTLADPARVESQISYWKYLLHLEHPERAQASMNKYCDKFIDANRWYIIEGMKHVLAEEKINLSLESCAEKASYELQQTDQTR